MVAFYVVLSYFLWAYLHEYSHLYMAKIIVGVKSYSMRLYPHKHPSLGLVFASVSYDYVRNPNPQELAWISFAPRFADVLALSVLPFTSELDWFWVILIGGGLVDMIRGSFIFSPTSDIKRYCDGWGKDYEDVRVIQLGLVAISLCLFFI